MAKSYIGWTELEMKYENNEELLETGSVFDEESGMYLVLREKLAIF